MGRVKGFKVHPGIVRVWTFQSFRQRTPLSSTRNHTVSSEGEGNGDPPRWRMSF